MRIPDLPPAWEGMRIVHLTDFQLGMWLQSRSLTPRALRTAARLRPDAVFLTGDFMHRGRWSRSGDLFASLARQAPTFAVLGNHDHLTPAPNADAIAEGLRAQGVTVLNNAHLPFRWREESWEIVGVDDFATEHTDLLRAVEGITPGTKLLALLTHVPDVAAFIPEGWFPLVVAGHTHGGQVRLPLRHHLASLHLPGQGRETRYVRGWYAVKDVLLYVNRGLGLSMLPLRFAAPPEVTLFVLTGGGLLPEGVRWRRGER